MGLEPSKAFDIKKKVNETIFQFQKWFRWCNALMYRFDEQPDDYFKKIFSDLPKIPKNFSTYKNEASLFESAYLKLLLNEAIGRQRDFIEIYEYIIKLPIKKVSQKTVLEYNENSSIFIVNSINKIDEWFTNTEKFKKLCLLVYDTEMPNSDDKKRLRKAKSVVNAFAKFLKENSNNPTKFLKLVEIASCLRLYLADESVVIPNFFFRYSTSKAKKSIHTELRNHDDAYEKNQIAAVELVRWQTFVFLGYDPENIKYYFKSLKRADELLKWNLEAASLSELKEKQKWTDTEFEKIKDIGVQPKIYPIIY